LLHNKLKSLYRYHQQKALSIFYHFVKIQVPQIFAAILYSFSEFIASLLIEKTEKVYVPILINVRVLKSI